jgi:hypothetical protein
VSSTPRTFLVDKRAFFLKWLKQNGSYNITLLERLSIFVEAGYYHEQHQWLSLLEKVVREAFGLRNISIYWDWYASQGAGNDMDFMRTLGHIKVLQKMTIDCFFAKHVQQYLEYNMGMKHWHAEDHSLSSLQEPRKYQRRPDVLTGRKKVESTSARRHIENSIRTLRALPSHFSTRPP